VTFTREDWRAPQVITVTGVDDTLRDGKQTYRIITDPAVSDDPSFNGKNPIDVTLENIDNDTAGITVVPTADLVTSEAGAQDTFTIVLNSKPEKDVTVNLVSDTPTEGVVSPQSLVFTPANWMAPQLATVTGVDDEAKDGPKEYKINVSSASDDPNYAHVPPTSVHVRNDDNDTPGVTFALVTGVDPLDSTKLRTSESGDFASFTVVLNTAPTNDVTIPVASDTVTEGTVSPESITFTPSNWNAPQAITVAGVEDEGMADGDQPYLIVLGAPSSMDPDYAALPESAVPAVNVDNDKPGFTVMFVTGVDPQDPSKLLTSEAGTTATFTLALNSKPSKSVKIDLYSSLAGEASVSPSSLTFTELNWQSPQTVSVTGLDDDFEDGSPVFFVRTSAAISEDPGYDTLDPPDVQVVNQDNDSAGVRVVLAKGVDPTNPNRLITDEFGSTATFTVALTSEPKDDVSISLVSSKTAEGTVSPATLIFTSVNYLAPQTVTITGRNDDAVDGNQPFTISVSAASSKDLNFDGKFASQVQLTNRDDDSAGVIVTPTSGLVTSEGGKTDSFTIRLQSKPSDKVTINVKSSAVGEGKPNVGSVVFTPDNWNANQTVVVTGVEDDGTADGSPTYKIVLDPAQSSDANYNGKPDPPDVTVTNLDNDTAGVIVSPTSGLTTGENGLKASFTIKLASKPVGSNVNVKIQLSSSRPAEGTVSPTSVTFDAVNWNSPQTVTVTGQNDDVADGNQPYMIVTSPASSIDPNYFNFNASDVSLTNIDDDSAGLLITPIPSATPAATSEKGQPATFTVALTSLPTADVTYTITCLDTSEGKVSPATLKFTSTNGKTPQTVTVTGINDDSADGDQQYTVRLSNGSSSDPGYNGKFGLDLPFINLDDDHPGIDVVAAADLQTTEKGAGTATFTVALKSQPTANVSIGVSSSNTAEGTVAPPTLQFTPANWSTPQTVTVTGVQDSVADGTQTYQVKLANASSPGANGDPAYNGKFATQLDVQNVDDDKPGYALSTPSSNQTTEAGGPVTFNVVLTSKPAGTSTVTLGLTSSNVKEGTVSASSLLFTGSDWDQPHPVTVTGVDDKKVDGNVTYQIVFAADADYGGAEPTALSLTNVDDDVLGVLVASTACATTPTTTATFTIRLNSQPSANVTIALSSDTPTEGTVAPDSVTFTPSGTGAWDTPQTVTITGQSGTAGMMTVYNIITADASAPGETTGYNGYTMVPDVSCTNTAP